MFACFMGSKSWSLQKSFHRSLHVFHDSAIPQGPGPSNSKEKSRTVHSSLYQTSHQKHPPQATPPHHQTSIQASLRQHEHLHPQQDRDGRRKVPAHPSIWRLGKSCQRCTRYTAIQQEQDTILTETQLINKDFYHTAQGL